RGWSSAVCSSDLRRNKRIKPKAAGLSGDGAKRALRSACADDPGGGTKRDDAVAQVAGGMIAELGREVRPRGLFHVTQRARRGADRGEIVGSIGDRIRPSADDHREIVGLQDDVGPTGTRE